MQTEVAVTEPAPVADVERVIVDPVVTEPAPVAEATDPKPGEQSAPEQEQEQARQSKARRRLDRQIARTAAAEAETKILREQLARLSDSGRPAQAADGEPKRDDFGDYESFIRALAVYDAGRVVKSAATETAKAAEQAKHNEQRETVGKRWVEREAAFEATKADYQDKVMAYLDDNDLSENARSLVLESKVGPALLYHLASNDAEAERIANLSPTRQLIELGKLEDTVNIPAKKSTKAPAPAVPGATHASGGKDPQTMTPLEYREFMRRNGSRWVT